MLEPLLLEPPGNIGAVPKQSPGDDSTQPEHRASGLRRLRSDPGSRKDRRGGGSALSASRLKRQVEPIASLGIRRWPAQKTRPIRYILILVSLLGPVLGLGIAVITIPAGPTDEVLSAGDGGDEDARPGANEIGARVTLLNPDLSRGEVTARVVLEPGSDLIVGSDQTLTRTIRVLFNDIAGRTQTVFETGSTIDPISGTLQLSGSRLTRYPVDSYKAQLVLLVQKEVDPGEGQAIEGDREFEPVPIVATVRSSLSDLRVSSTSPGDGGGDVLAADFDLERPRTVVAFAIALMALAWLLALGCVALAWGVLVQAREIPFWCWGFYAGVLFALPQLRNGLPGSPPFGSLIDWSIYYWALGMVAVSLLALILAGNLALRAAVSDPQPDHPADAEGESGDDAPTR